jgi:hypothetical protein
VRWRVVLPTIHSAIAPVSTDTRVSPQAAGIQSNGASTNSTSA